MDNQFTFLEKQIILYAKGHYGTEYHPIDDLKLLMRSILWLEETQIIGDISCVETIHLPELKKNLDISLAFRTRKPVQVKTS